METRGAKKKGNKSRSQLNKFFFKIFTTAPPLNAATTTYT
jgi:hypothetical protein